VRVEMGRAVRRIVGTEGSALGAPCGRGPRVTDYLLLYSGGSMPETQAEQAAVMKAWNEWMHALVPSTRSRDRRSRSRRPRSP
jgi:hypothetical protein